MQHPCTISRHEAELSFSLFLFDLFSILNRYPRWRARFRILRFFLSPIFSDGQSVAEQSRNVTHDVVFKED